LIPKKDIFIRESPLTDITTIWGSKMKTKLIVLIICGMLMTSFFVLAKPPENMVLDKQSPTRATSSSDANVPVWEIGDYWTYKIDNISISFEEENQTINLFISIDSLPLTVTNDTGSYYTLSFSTTTSGHAKIDGDLGDGPINISITFSSVKISGDVMIEKTTLGIKSISALLKGRFIVDVIEQPYINLSLQTIPVPITMNTITTFGVPISMLSFPLSTSTSWNLSATNFTVNGKIHSIWLNILHFINLIAKLLGNEFLPPEIESLLPVVDIKDALITFGIGNIFQIPEIPDAFLCMNTENISVPAGNYEAYNISMAGGLAQAFYAPAAGNVVKITGNIEQIIPYIHNINMELLETNYS